MAGRRVVGTGGAWSIGKALARRCATEGAFVAVNGLDAGAPRWWPAASAAWPCPATPSAAVAPAREALGGEIDVFCANAGVAPEGGEQAAEAWWATARDVDVMARVGAARELLPGRLARGHGRLVATVSAAGLLTMVGSAPCSVSKHAAQAFVEWLDVTCRHRGVRVHAWRPQGAVPTCRAAPRRPATWCRCPTPSSGRQSPTPCSTPWPRNASLSCRTRRPLPSTRHAPPTPAAGRRA